MKHTAWRSFGIIIGALILSASSASAQGFITTVAGSTWVFTGAGGLATSAPLGQIPAVAVDANGNVFAADVGNHLVVKIDKITGNLTVVAGNGRAGFFGDSGPAVSAQLNRPSAVAFDANGNLYIADQNNQRIRQVTLPGGTINTVAGNGIAAFSGDAGLATAASLNDPSGVAVDASGILYIADKSNNRIRKVIIGGNITTIAGDGTAGSTGDGGVATSARVNAPLGLAVDAGGTLYIADSGNNKIRKIATPSVPGNITLAAGNGFAGFSGEGGAATSATLNAPAAVSFDGSGNFFIADTFNARIRKVTINTGNITTVAGSGTAGFSGEGPVTATSAQLNRPGGVGLDTVTGTFYIADTVNSRVRKVASGSLTTFGGNGLFKFAGDNGAATSAFLNAPLGAVLDPTTGNLLIADTSNNRVRKVTSGGTISTSAGNGLGAFSGDSGAATSASLNGPSALAVDGAGNLYIADTNNQRIRMITPGGTISTVAGNGFAGFSGDSGPATAASLNGPGGVAVDAAGTTLYIADTGNHRVRKVSGGTITTLAGTGVAGFSGDNGAGTSAQLNQPRNVALNRTTGDVYIADSLNQVIRKVIPNGTISTVAGTPGVGGFSGNGGPATSAQLFTPSGVAVDGSGNLYIADTSNAQIRKVSLNGTITSIAGTGTAGFSGDLGPATAAALNFPFNVSVDAAGNIFIADVGNDRIRKIFGGLVTAGPSAGGPAGTAQIPITLTLGSGLSVDSLTFGLTLTANASTPALSGSLSFVQDASLRLPDQVDTSVGPNIISVGWVTPPLSPTLTGTARLGVVVVNIPANATAGVSSYTVQVTGASGSVTGTPVTLLPGPNATLLVGRSYLVGDAFPVPSVAGDLNGDGTFNEAGEFGDGTLGILDVINALRTVNNVPGFLVPSCSDRFDAMDSFPVDTATRGGDSVLNILDLIQTLRRVNNVDPSRPLRFGRGLACPSPPPLQTLAREAGRAGGEGPSAGLLELGAAQVTDDGLVQIPIYLQGLRDLDLAGLTFALGASGGPSLRFVAAEALMPSLVDDALPGVLSVAWLGGFHISGGEPILLGYVQTAGLEGAGPWLEFYGVSAAQADGRSVTLDFLAAPTRRGPQIQ